MIEFESKDDAIEWMCDTVDDLYIDNIRFAFMDDDEAIAKYDEQQARGCCGFFDEEIIVANKPATVGCNYGH